MEAQYNKFASKPGMMTSKDATKWFNDGKLLSGNCNSNNLDICFSKIKTKGKNTITFDEFDKKLVPEVAKAYAKQHKCDENAAMEKIRSVLGNTEKDLASGTTKQSKTGGVEKMTDTSQYTGAHKERFDESGKGKGAAGREDKVDNTGYVGQYKGDGTYDKKH